MKYLWCIASYHRVDRQPLLQLLRGWGYQREDIVISTQTREDYEAYSRAWGQDAVVIYREGSCISDNRNTLMEYAQDFPDRQIVMSSDKVRGYRRLSKDGKSLIEVGSREEMERMLDWMVEIRDRFGGEIAGCYSVGNAFYMSHSIHINQQMLGCFMIFRPQSPWRFDPNARLKEDFEIIMRIISNGGRVVRINNVAIKATLHTQGGCHELWNSRGDEVNRECTEYILAKYPSLLRKHPTRKNEVKYIGLSKNIKIKP